MGYNKITKEKLYEATLKRLVSDGYHGTSLKMLAEDLKVAKASLLHHASSKEQLFIDAIINCPSYKSPIYKSFCAFRMILDNMHNNKVKLNLLIFVHENDIFCFNEILKLATAWQSEE